MLSDHRFLVVGLGNPGKKYHLTRHNVGFMFLDFLAHHFFLTFQNKRTYEISETVFDQNRLFLLKPLQYMNLSGIALRTVMDYYKIDPKNVIVCYDDTAFDIGIFKLKFKGSHGGHNGLGSAIKELGTQEFCRLRIGVGSKPPQAVLSDYVLSSFSKADLKLIEEQFPTMLEALSMIFQDGIQKAMGQFNGS